MITLRKLALTTLDVKYARAIDEKNIIHYSVNYMRALSLGLDPDRVVRDFISKTDNTTDQIEIIKDETVHNIVDARGILDPKTRKQLEKKEIKSTLHSYSIPMWKHPLGVRKGDSKTFIKVIHYLKEAFNSIIAPFNKGLNALGFKGIKKLETDYIRTHTPCHYLTVGFEEGDQEEAQKSLLKDLRILSDRKSIMGHLSMPSLMKLADTVGNGKAKYVLFCFLFVDSLKIMEPGKDTIDYKELELLSSVGIENEQFEGNIRWLNDSNPKSKYEIEEVNVLLNDDYKEFAEAYQKQLDEAKERRKAQEELKQEL